MKKCFKCGTEKPATGEFFYRHSRMGDGFLGKCKECTKKDVHARYIEKHDEILNYDRKINCLPHRVQARKDYLNTDNGKKVQYQILKNYRGKFPEKYKAHTLVHNAIRDGKLTKQPCSESGCGNPKSEAHHDDYSKPLEVRWLCKKHHRIADKERIEREKCQPL